MRGARESGPYRDRGAWSTEGAPLRDDQLARDTGMTREGLHKALSPDGNPECATVLKVIWALGLELHGAAAHR
jgi:hypothetical protein